MKQAKIDLKAALEFLPSAKNGPTFNWICYMCYQVYIYFTDNITIKIYDIDSRALHVVFDTTIVDISLSVAYDVNGFTKVLQFSPPIKLTATR
jgi:hypothetical protein